MCGHWTWGLSDLLRCVIEEKLARRKATPVRGLDGMEFGAMCTNEVCRRLAAPPRSRLPGHSVMLQVRVRPDNVNCRQPPLLRSPTRKATGQREM